MAATNHNLPEAAERGEFREDLYYRLDVAPVHIDPLRERPEDIIPLVHQFLREFSIGATTPMTKLAPEPEGILLAHPWKGNVRELRNAVERVALLEEDNTLRPEHLSFLGAAAKLPGLSRSTLLYRLDKYGLQA